MDLTPHAGPSLRSGAGKSSGGGTFGKRRKRRRTLSLGAPPVKPTLTERQQLQLAMQLSSPVSSPLATHEEKSGAERGKLSKRNDRGETLLHSACIKGDVSAVKALIDTGADVHATDNANWTPLHEACNHGFLDIVQCLLDHEADIQAKGHDDITPLHDAVFCGHYEIASVLVQRGADPSCPNTLGVSPLEVAEDDGDKRMVCILKSGGDPGEEQSLKISPRKSLQFAVHEKQETPKKESTDSFLFDSKNDSLMVSVPLTVVQVRKCLMTEFKNDGDCTAQATQSAPESEEMETSAPADLFDIPTPTPSESPTKQPSSLPDPPPPVKVETPEEQSADDLYSPVTPNPLEPDEDRAVLQEPESSPPPEDAVKDSQMPVSKDADDSHVSSSDTDDNHPESPHQTGKEAEVESNPLKDYDSDGDEDMELPEQESNCEDSAATGGRVENVSGSDSLVSVEGSSAYSRTEDTSNSKDQDIQSDDRSGNCQEGEKDFDEAFDLSGESCDSYLKPASTLEQSDEESIPVLKKDEDSSSLSLDHTNVTEPNPPEEPMDTDATAEDTDHDVPPSSEQPSPKQAVEDEKFSAANPSSSDGETKDGLVEKTTTPTPTTMVISVPQDHTYCGQPTSGFVPPAPSSEPTLANPSAQSSLDCLLTAAVGTYLSNKSAPVRPVACGSAAKKNPKWEDKSRSAEEEECVPSNDSSSPCDSGQEKSKLSFPVSLKFPRPSTPGASKQASGTPEDHPLFSLATIASGSSPYPTSGKPGGPLQPPQSSSRPGRGSTAAARQSTRPAAFHSPGNRWSSDNLSALPPKKRFRPVHTSDVCAHRVAYSRAGMGTDCKPFLNFTTLSGSKPLAPSGRDGEEVEMGDRQNIRTDCDSRVYALIEKQKFQMTSLKAQHSQEQERLQVHFESELIRAHTKACVPQPPPSVCDYLMEAFRLAEKKDLPPAESLPTHADATLTPDQHRRSTDDKKQQLIQSYVTDVWDKVYVLKTRLVRRQEEEMRNLRRQQREDFLEVLTEQKLF